MQKNDKILLMYRKLLLRYPMITIAKTYVFVGLFAFKEQQESHDLLSRFRPVDMTLFKKGNKEKLVALFKYKNVMRYAIL